MGRKKKKTETKPFCFYCDREFDDENVLISHQMAKHFKCSTCARKLSNISGLVVHCFQVHKEKITNVPNAKHDRDRVDIDITGMDGVPDEAIYEHQSRVAGTGNESNKKAKFSHEEDDDSATSASSSPAAASAAASSPTAAAAAVSQFPQTPTGYPAAPQSYPYSAYPQAQYGAHAGFPPRFPQQQQGYPPVPGMPPQFGYGMRPPFPNAPMQPHMMQQQQQQPQHHAHFHHPQHQQPPLGQQHGAVYSGLPQTQSTLMAQQQSAMSTINGHQQPYSNLSHAPSDIPVPASSSASTAQASLSTAAGSVPLPKPVAEENVVMIYDDEENSLEEKRAQRYAKTSQVSQLADSISARINALTGVIPSSS